MIQLQTNKHNEKFFEVEVKFKVKVHLKEKHSDLKEISEREAKKLAVQEMYDLGVGDGYVDYLLNMKPENIKILNPKP